MRLCSARLIALTLGVFPPMIHSAGAQQPVPKAERPAAKTAKAAASPLNAEIAKLRADADARLKEIAKISDKDLTSSNKAVRDLLNERIQWLDEWDKATKAHQAALNPKPSPDVDLTERRAELERAKEAQTKVVETGAIALPTSFQETGPTVDDARLKEMREAIDAAKSALKDKTDDLEKLRAEPAARTARINALRIERDKTHTKTTTLANRRREKEAAIASATSEDGKRLARERLLNFDWEERVETERLAAAEASLALETKRAPIAGLALQIQEINVNLAKMTVTVLSDRYRVFSERQKADLQRAAVIAKSRAAKVDDPLEKFRAIRTAEHLGIQAQILEDNKTLSGNPLLAPAEQLRLANQAEKDFAKLQQMVKDNRSGAHIALRLNNDFRRISRERAQLLRQEFAQSSAALTYYENALTETELNYFNDARDDKFERDSFLQTMPADRQAEIKVILDGLEATHKKLLGERREVLNKLLANAEETYNQVSRRLKTLDEQYAFIRTTLFWVRDSEPISASTFAQARREFARLLGSMAQIASEPVEKSLWTAPSVEFSLGVLALIILPWIIRRGRVTLRAMVS